jgi:hypothetical protein
MLTGHEMPCELDAVKKFLIGRKRRAAERLMADFSRFLPHIIEHKRDP